MLRTPSGPLSHLARARIASPSRLQSIRSARTVMLVSDRQITLTPEEDRLCSLLDDFKLHVQQTKPDSPQVECRIAGGWVRDKVRVTVTVKVRRPSEGEAEKLELTPLAPPILPLPSGPLTLTSSSFLHHSSSPCLATTSTSPSRTTPVSRSRPRSPSSSARPTPRLSRPGSQRSSPTRNRANTSRQPNRTSWGWNSTTST